MISVARLFRSPAARAAAFAALIVFGWQGALPAPAVVVLEVFDPPEHATVAPAELAPAYTILPTAPSQIATPSPPKPRPLAAATPTAIAPESLPPAPRPAADTIRNAARWLEALFFPPYAARGPPLLS